MLNSMRNPRAGAVPPFSDGEAEAGPGGSPGEPRPPGSPHTATGGKGSQPGPPAELSCVCSRCRGRTGTPFLGTEGGGLQPRRSVSRPLGGGCVGTTHGNQGPARRGTCVHTWHTWPCGHREEGGGGGGSQLSTAAISSPLPKAHIRPQPANGRTGQATVGSGQLPAWPGPS